MNVIETYLGTDREHVRPLGGGIWQVTLGDVEMAVACAGDDCDLVCQADVGALDGVGAKDLFLEDALKANFLWIETKGATLSLHPETGVLVLSCRREADGFADAGAVAAFLGGFAGMVRKWRQYAANCSPSPAEDNENTTDMMRV